MTEKRNFDLAPLEAFLSESFVRASGPGGQNVNKVATAVQLRLDVASAPLPDELKERLGALAGRRLSGGSLIIDARRYRTRERNRQDARERLASLLARAAARPRPRRATRPSAASQRRRLEEKRRRGDRKRGRSRIDPEA